MVEATLGFEGLAINAWLVWMLPFVGAAAIAGVARYGQKIRNYFAVGLSLASAISATTMLPLGIAGGEIHSQVPWISVLGLEAGGFCQPVSLLMFCLCFMVFFGWEGVGLASYALIGFWYHDRKKDYVGREGERAAGIPLWASPTHSGMKAFLMTRAGDTMMLAGMFLIFAYAGTFGFRELIENQEWANQMAQQNLLVPAGVFLVARIGPLFFALAAFGMTQFFEVVAWTGAITALLLATQAIVNPEIKKVLAYSTGSQIGYMMMALGIAGLSTQFVEGYTAGFFHLMSHALFKASLFMGAGALLHTVGSRFLTNMGGMRRHMKKTYIFMMLSGLSLAGAPLITSGFWSKDAIFASLLDSGTSTGGALFIIAFIVAIMTAFYTFRMVGMVFFGTKSKHIQAMEQTSSHTSQSVSYVSSEPSGDDHHNLKQDTKPKIHEVTPIMWLPFAILAVSTILIGLVGFIFEVEIHSIMASYLFSSFGIGEAISTHNSANNIEQIAGQTTEALNPIALVSSFVAFGIGSGLGILFYIIRKKDPEIISRYPILKKAWSFLYNRWYLNSLLYWGFVTIPLRLYQIIWLYFENIIAQGINPALQFSMSYLSKWVKYTQTGVTQTYLFVFAAGIIIVLIMLYL